jgi:hypothetical protein
VTDIYTLGALLMGWFFGKWRRRGNAGQPSPPWPLVLDLLRDRMRAENEILHQRARRLAIENDRISQRPAPKRRKRKL